MRNHLPTTIAVLLYAQIVLAQSDLITCSSVRNADNSISIFAESNAYSEYTVKLIFTSLQGYDVAGISKNMLLTSVLRGKNELVKIYPSKNALSYSFQYRYLYYPGKAMRKAPDTSIAYLLPAASGHTVHISSVISVAEGLGQQKTNDYAGIGFVYTPGDTICAARAGIVYQCRGDITEGEKQNDFFKAARNSISIQHKDGSLSTYDVLAPMQLLVQPGDHIIPGTPLAVFNKAAEKYLALFSVYYLDEKKVLSEDNSNTSASSFVYLPAYFYLSDATAHTVPQLNMAYTAQHPAQVIAAEMNKREKKKAGYQ